jgi:hypothetical protein
MYPCHVVGAVMHLLMLVHLDLYQPEFYTTISFKIELKCSCFNKLPATKALWHYYIRVLEIENHISLVPVYIKKNLL